MNIWQDLNKTDRKAILGSVAKSIGINAIAIEKDWWVTVVLKALFLSKCSPYLHFKGGTSLSKGWDLIDRLSEDADLSISHKFFGIDKTTKNQREKLRKQSRQYIIGTLSKELDENLKKLGVKDYSVETVTTVETMKGIKEIDSDKDPTVLMVNYQSVLDDNLAYIPPRVKVEISCLSMDEPFETKEISSLISKYYPDEDKDTISSIPTVLPTRTFLEKAFLLDEEFQKDKPRSHRMSRHLYDLEKLMDTSFGKEALEDGKLYAAIIDHRLRYYAIKYVDYSHLMPSTITFVPPERVRGDWRLDYSDMRNSFIYDKNSLDFEGLIKRIEELQQRFRKVKVENLEIKGYDF